MYISLIGGSDTGKTCYFGGLHKSFRHHQAADVITNGRDIEQLKQNDVTKRVRLLINKYEYSTDKDKLDKIADLLSQSPIEWPSRTDFADFFPIYFHFETYIAGQKMNIQRRDKKITIRDIPGGYFRNDMNGLEAAEDSRKAASLSQGLLVFIDSSLIGETFDAEYEKVKKNIKTIIRTAVKGIEIQRAFLPVSIILAKSDEWGNEAKRKQIHDTIFNNLCLDISTIDEDMILMSCPTSVTRYSKTQFSQLNLQYPFLFVAMCMIFSQHHKLIMDSVEARNTRQRGWFARFKQWMDDPRTIGHMERESARDLELAMAINDSMKGDVLLGRTDLKFAQNGNPIDIDQMISVL